MKIRHYASPWPKNLKVPLTPKENKFFRSLELSDNFEKSITEIRRKYKIPKNGFSYRKEHEVGLGIPKYLDFDIWNQYLEDESIIADKYGFAGTWGLSLTYFIKYNYMPKMAREIEHRAAIFDAETTLQILQNDYPAQLKRQVCITLREKLGKEQLKSLIDLQWSQIEELMRKLPAWRANRLTNIQLYKEITYLRNKEKKSWKVVTDNISAMHPENDYVSDENYLRMIYNRYSKKLKTSR